VYVVRDASEHVEAGTVVASIAQAVGGWNNSCSTRVAGNTDRNALVNSLRQLKPSIRPSSDRAWWRDAALRVIDCVLSLNRQYDSFVVPRLDRFEGRHPEIRTIAELQGLMSSYASSAAFVVQCLGYHDDSRSVTLAKVVDWLVKIAEGGDYNKQMSNLERWATDAKPDDHLKLGIAGFGLGGF
jgi:hypothetical protein